MFQIVFIFCCLFIQSAVAAPKILIGIAGGTGSGKTTLAKNIQEAFPEHSILISADSYYKDLTHLPLEEQDQVNFDHPDSLDFDLMRRNLLDLKNGLSIHQPSYNFQTHSRSWEKSTQRIDSAQIIIVEGILLFALPEMRQMFDLKLFVDADSDIRILRRIERDINERGRDFKCTKEQYIKTVKPMHEAFVEPSKKYADVIIPKGGQNQIALSMILSKLREALAEI